MNTKAIIAQKVSNAKPSIRDNRRAALISIDSPVSEAAKYINDLD